MNICRIFLKLTKFSLSNAALPEQYPLQFLTNGRTATKSPGNGLTLQNRWDSAACHKDLTMLIGPERLIVQFIGENSGYRSVFAERPIPKEKSGIFYYEVKILEKRDGIFIGLATEQMPLNKWVGKNKGTYAYSSWGDLWVEGADATNYESDYAVEGFEASDVIGCGVDLANRQIIYTKNGLRLETDGLHVDFGADLFPCVTLYESGTKIEANFGPNFKFNIDADGI